MTDFAFPVLVGDIGGTNARFQIVPDAQAEPISFPHIATADFETIESAIESAIFTNTDLKPKTAILAAAGPITPKGLDLTNCPWNIKPDAFLDFSSIDDLVLFNDFDAQALALPSLIEDDLLPIGDAQALTEASNNERTKAVLGPGTGLGVATLARAGDIWVPIGGEGGHIDLGPSTGRESEIWSHFKRWPSNTLPEGRVSGESALCGSGLQNLYQAVCLANNVSATLAEPKDISAAALANSNDEAHEALSLFCTLLGRVAGDLALTTMPKGGVYLAGGIAPKIATFLAESNFRAAFEDKAPHRDVMKTIPTYIVTHPVPALVGLVAYAKKPNTFGLSLADRRWTS